MEPNYHHLQLVVLNKHDGHFLHGDVVAFRCEELSSVLVKRIVAVPEDTAQISNGTLWINGLASRVYSEKDVISFAGILAEPIKLGPEQYLVLGDNLTESKDSRYLEVGIVSKEDIFGKICAASWRYLRDAYEWAIRRWCCIYLLIVLFAFK